MIETVLRIGVCTSKALGYGTLFYQVKIKLSRMYRVWPMPGFDESVLLHPSEFMDKWKNEVSYKVETNAQRGVPGAG